MPPSKRTPHQLSLDESFLRGLGQVIREHRYAGQVKPQINQDDFADLVGVYRSHMGQIEQGRLDLRVGTLLAIARAMGLPLSSLVLRTEKHLAQEKTD